MFIIQKLKNKHIFLNWGSWGTSHFDKTRWDKNQIFPTKAISNNGDAITSNRNLVDTNEQAILTNGQLINNNDDAITSNRDLVNANEQAINTNGQLINNNGDEISSNDGEITNIENNYHHCPGQSGGGC